jgi:transcriptional regulator with GAF, ATPase, and Fis domain
MLAPTMATTRKPTKPTTKPSGRPSTRRPAAVAPPKTFAEVGREAAREAQRKVLLESWKANGWNMTATAEALGMGSGPAVIRALKTLAPDEYEAAKTDGRVSPANRRES